MDIKLKLFVNVFAASMLLGCGVNDKNEKMYSLWYDEPAVKWLESLPQGNGRLGIMPDGGIDHEIVVLNEKTMWSGSVADNRNPKAAESLPLIRKLLAKGDNVEAQEVMYKNFIPSNLPLKGGSYGCYQLLGNLKLDYEYSHPNDSVTAYERELDLEQGIQTVSFTKHNKFKRTYFVSRSSDVAVIHLTADNGELAFKATLDRPKNGSSRVEDDRLILEGCLDSGNDNSEGLKYIAKMAVKTKGGNVRYENGVCYVDSSDEALIVLSAATDYYTKEYESYVDKLISEAFDLGYERMKDDYISEYRSLYDRVYLRLGKGCDVPDSEKYWMNPTDERLKKFQETDDPSLVALYYCYARYLLISSICDGTLPPNLQGLWANTIQTPWNGDYHLNINIQMIHWLIESGNLSELHLPLVELTKNLVESGEMTAKAFYGEDAKGWVAHMKTNAWKFTAPGQHPSWGATNTGGAWLCSHLWEHYLYTQDKEYLKSVYPVMKGASEFFVSTLMTEPEHGWLVTAPSSSPENSFKSEDMKHNVSICMGPTMDNQLLRELFGNVIEASTILGVDEDYRQKLLSVCEKLPPHQISSEGYLMEWLKDYKEVDIHHRHISHLYGLYPGNLISLSKTPDLAEACKVTLQRREGNFGPGKIGWSLAWRINLWARLGEADDAYRMLRYLFTPRFDNKVKKGITSENLLCSCAGNFQLDGNIGGAAGISEMLLQCHDGFVHFLPALPEELGDGELKGFKIKGGATVDMRWENASLSVATITAPSTKGFSYELMIPRNDSSVYLYCSNEKKDVTGLKSVSVYLKPGEKITLKVE